MHKIVPAHRRELSNTHKVHRYNANYRNRLGRKTLNEIEDFWVTAEKELPDSWTGKTTFELKRPLPPVGHSYIEGRLTKTQETTRPGNIWPEIWRSMSKKMKQQAISAWEVEDKRREQAREIRGIKFVPEEEVDNYTEILAEVRVKLALPDVPSMPVLSRGGTSIAGVKPQKGFQNSGWGNLQRRTPRKRCRQRFR